MIPVELITSDETSDELTDASRLFWVMQIRGLDRYQKQLSSFPDLEGRLVAAQLGTLADPTLKLSAENYSKLICRTLNAGELLIKGVGSGRDRIEAGPRGVNVSRQGNREEFIEDGLNALYDSGVAATQIEIARNAFILDINLY